MAKTFSRQEGFTLVELMITVTIVGVLSSLAVQEYDQFTGKVKRAEATYNMVGLKHAQMAYLSEFGRWGKSLSEIGFRLDGALNPDTSPELFTATSNKPDFVTRYYEYRFRALSFGSVQGWYFLAQGDIDGNKDEPLNDQMYLIHLPIIKCEMRDGILLSSNDLTNYYTNVVNLCS